MYKQLVELSLNSKAKIYQKKIKTSSYLVIFNLLTFLKASKTFFTRFINKTTYKNFVIKTNNYF